MTAPAIGYPIRLDPINAWRGDFLDLELDLLDLTGQPVDLYSFGHTWAMEARMNMTDPDDEAVTFTPDLSNVVGGKLLSVKFTLTGTGTAAMVGAKYGYDVQATGGSRSPWTVWTGLINVDGDYTRA